MGGKSTTGRKVTAFMSTVGGEGRAFSRGTLCTFTLPGIGEGGEKKRLGRGLGRGGGNEKIVSRGKGLKVESDRNLKGGEDDSRSFPRRKKEDRGAGRGGLRGENPLG